MKIAITARDFSTNEPTALAVLQVQGFEIADYSDAKLGAATSETVMIEKIGDAEVAIVGLEPVTAAVINACPNLKMISRRGIGYDSLDLDACKQRGITVLRTAGVVEGAVAEQVMAYVLYFARALHTQNAYMQNAQWHRILVSGAKSRTIGLVGFGGIGKEIAARAAAFGMRVVYYNRHPDEEAAAALGATYLPLDELLAQSDYVSLNVPLTDSTRGFMDAEKISKMKPDAVLINIARSQVVVVDALVAALKNGTIKGAAVDVFEAEPCTDSPLVGCETALLTPHTAPYTSENFVQMNLVAAQNVVDYTKGAINPKHFLI